MNHSAKYLLILAFLADVSQGKDLMKTTPIEGEIEQMLENDGNIAHRDKLRGVLTKYLIDVRKCSKKIAVQELLDVVDGARMKLSVYEFEAYSIVSIEERVSAGGKVSVVLNFDEEMLKTVGVTYTRYRK